jgi:cation:H+ antiporter
MVEKAARPLEKLTFSALFLDAEYRPLLFHATILTLSFPTILVGCELFTNGVEWAGERLSLAEAAVGSLLAAVGTALPETLIPAVALLSGSSGHHAVGVGAIIGAPLMLSTIALFVMGIGAFAYRRRRGRIVLRVVREDARRDLTFFFSVFVVFAGCGLLHLTPPVRHVLAVVALLVYSAYAVMMLRLSRAADAEMDHGLYLETLLRGNPNRPHAWTIGVQVAAGIVAILIGAKEFVDQIVLFSARAGVNPGVLSLVLSPLATELPEKYNSVVWIRQSKDHLALANITGAMVFQSCIPVALGLAFSPWVLSAPEILASVIALLSAVILFINLRDAELGMPTLMIGGTAYAIFLAGLLYLEIFSSGRGSCGAPRADFRSFSVAQMTLNRY